MILLQLIIFCIVFTLMVRVSVIGGAINGLYFYPVEYQDIAYNRGIADKEITQKKRIRFMIPFISVMFITLILIVGVWNKVTDFKSAYTQSVLFLEVMNWYDGIFIDRVWVGHSSFWIIKGMEDQPYVQSWHDVKVKRGLLTLIWPVFALIPASIICFVGYL